jgi:ATP-dependent Zn protease
MSVKLMHRLNDFEERLEALEKARSQPPLPRGGGGQENDDGDATAEKSNRKIKRIQQQQHEQQQNSIADRRRRLDNMYAKLEDLKG